MKRTTSKRDTRSSRIRDFGRWFSWDEVFLNNTCTGKFSSFYNIITSAIDKFLPVKSCRVSDSDRPWLTHHVKSLIEKRQKRLSQHGKNSPLFRMWRNKVQTAIAQAKESYYDGKVKCLKETNVGRWWKEVKNIAGIAGSAGEWYSQLIDGSVIGNINTLCEQINDFFTGLGSHFSPLSSLDVCNITVSDIPQELSATPNEAEKALQAIQLRKAPGPDGLPNIILKEFAFELGPVISGIYNASLCEGYIPSSLKSVNVRPLPKRTPACSILDDVRPVSLTCQVAKPR